VLRALLRVLLPLELVTALVLPLAPLPPLPATVPSPNLLPLPCCLACGGGWWAGVGGRG